MLLLQTTLTIAVAGPATSPEYLALRVAEAEGYFTDERLRVTLPSVRAEAAAAEALAPGGRGPAPRPGPGRAAAPRLRPHRGLAGGPPRRARQGRLHQERRRSRGAARRDPVAGNARVRPAPCPARAGRCPAPARPHLQPRRARSRLCAHRRHRGGRRRRGALDRPPARGPARRCPGGPENTRRGGALAPGAPGGCRALR